MGATNTLYTCLNTQSRLDEILADSANPVTKMKDTLGFLKAVNSPLNRQGWDALPIQMPGRSRPSSTSNRKVALSGRVKACPTVKTVAINPCTGETAETTDLVDVEVQIANYRGSDFTIDRNLYRDTCDSPDGHAAGVIAYKLIEHAEAILKQEDIDLVTRFQANTGLYFDGTNSDIGSGTEKTIPLYSSTVPRVPQPGNYFILLEEYRRKGYDVPPIVVGGTGLGRFAFDANLYTGNLDGSDITKMPAQLPTYIDYQVDSIAADGASHLNTFIPGHIQMLYWHDFAAGSPLARSNGEITKTTVNIAGEIFDLVVYDSNCDDEVDFTLSRYSQPWQIPSATFFSSTCGGEFSLLNWDVDCADTTCDNILIPGNIIT